MFVGRHVAVAFPFFHNSFVNGDNGRMVCLYERQAVIYTYIYIKCIEMNKYASRVLEYNYTSSQKICT